MKLDKNRILELLAAADTKWYHQHPSPTSRWSYREHLDFTADHIAKNYDKESKCSSGDNHNHNKRKKVQAERLL